MTLPANNPKGREQEGYRPIIVVGVPKGIVRYPVVIAVPLTTQGHWWLNKNPSLYKLIPRGSGGLSRDLMALIDQIRAIDVQRVHAYLGSLEPGLLKIIRTSMFALFC